MIYTVYNKLSKVFLTFTLLDSQVRVTITHELEGKRKKGVESVTVRLTSFTKFLG